MTIDLTKDPRPLIVTLARLYALEGNTRGVTVLVHADPTIQQTGWDNWNGGTALYTLYLELPLRLYAQVQPELDALQEELLDRLGQLWKVRLTDWLDSVRISPTLSAEDNWQDKAREWLAGEGVNNQGRVRSDNIASREKDGLLFRSQPEINLYTALKAAGVSFAPLPVFVRGGKEYRRIEPDFVILKDGLVLVVEVDGDTVHQETPAEAHVRTTMLEYEGAHIERIPASSCETPQAAASCARRLVELIAKLKASRS